MKVTIGNKCLYQEWCLALTQILIANPQVLTTTSNITDLSDQFEPVKYRERRMDLVFDTTSCIVSWDQLLQQMTNHVQNRKVKICLAEDSGYYYYGKLAVNSGTSSESLKKLVLTGEVEPYKYEVLSSTEKWLWDSFHFEQGAIRYYKDLKVSGSLQLMIPGSKKKVVPAIFTTADMLVKFGGKQYQIKTGMNKIYDIWMGEGENHLTLEGTGTISVDYRGGYF